MIVCLSFNHSETVQLATVVTRKQIDSFRYVSVVQVANEAVAMNEGKQNVMLSVHDHQLTLCVA